MITVRAGKGAIGFCLLLLASGCSREQQDWRSAEAADTIEAYGQFIQRHPESELATQARTRVAQLGEDRDWQHAGSADTVEAYREFITQHPNGKWAQEARIRIENFSLSGSSTADSAAAGGSASVGSGPAGSRAMAHGGPAAGAPASAGPVATGAATGLGSAAAGKPGTGGFGVQLGAFSSEASANNEWRTLAGRFGPELQGLHQHVVAADSASGHIYRLQATVGDEGRARAICESLRKRGQACVAVFPH